MGKRRILIVDDEVKFTRMVRLNLERTGEFEVREENRAVAALAAAREFKPDLIILDVLMPGLDGGDVANLIKNDKALKGTPIVFLTAAVSPPEAGRTGLRAGGDLFLGKPISLDALLDCIHRLLPKEPPPEPAPPAGPGQPH